jgi:hypothetical protein
VRELDLYGKPVTMTYRGKQTFKTTFGGFVSLALFLLFLSALGLKLRDLINRNNTQVKKNTLVSISNSYTPPEVISERNITFAYMLSNFYGEGNYDEPKYGFMGLEQFEVRIKTDGQREFHKYNIPVSKCKLGVNFFYKDYDEIKEYGIENYFCPDYQNITIQGNWHSPVFAGVSLYYQRCS